MKSYGVKERGGEKDSEGREKERKRENIREMEVRRRKKWKGS